MPPNRISAPLLSTAAVIALVGYCLLACYLHERYCILFDEGYTQFRVHACGNCMLHFIMWGAGLAGWLFICTTNAKSRLPRACVWGMLQFIAAWVLAYPAARLSQINDGLGIALILFAPLATLPSFVVAFLAANTPIISSGSFFYRHSRLFSLLVILAFIITTLSTFLYEEFQELHNNAYTTKYQSTLEQVGGK